MGAPDTHSSTEITQPNKKVVLIRLLADLQGAIEALLDELIKEV